MVGVERFELPTPCSQSRCATRLRYAPQVQPLSASQVAIASTKLDDAGPREQEVYSLLLRAARIDTRTGESPPCSELRDS